MSVGVVQWERVRLREWVRVRLLEPVRMPEGRSPYLSPAFAAGMAVTKAVRGNLLPTDTSEAGALPAGDDTAR